MNQPGRFAPLGARCIRDVAKGNVRVPRQNTLPRVQFKSMYKRSFFRHSIANQHLDRCAKHQSRGFFTFQGVGAFALTPCAYNNLGRIRDPSDRVGEIRFARSQAGEIHHAER
jgi:hypothetical protein